VSLRRVGRAISAHPVVHLEDREALPPVPVDRPVVGRHEVATACHDLRVEIRGVGAEAETVTERLTQLVVFSGTPGSRFEVAALWRHRSPGPTLPVRDAVA